MSLAANPTVDSLVAPAVESAVSASTLPEGARGWSALRVKPRHEVAVARALALLGYESYVPLHLVRRRWSDRVKQLRVPLFAGYSFCRFSAASRLPVLRLPGVRGVVGFGGRPAEIDANEMAAVQAVAASRLPIRGWPFVRQGQPVELVSGPLCGLRGILERTQGTDRLVVSVQLLQRSVAVEIRPGTRLAPGSGSLFGYEAPARFGSV